MFVDFMFREWMNLIYREEQFSYMTTVWTGGHQCAAVEWVSVSRFKVQKLRLRFIFQVKDHVSG